MVNYMNRCELEKAICESGNKFQYAHHGVCEGKDRATKDTFAFNLYWMPLKFDLVKFNKQPFKVAPIFDEVFSLINWVMCSY